MLYSYFSALFKYIMYEPCIINIFDTSFTGNYKLVYTLTLDLISIYESLNHR